VTERVAARLLVEVVYPDRATGRISSDTTPGTPMWMDGDGVRLTLTTDSGAVLLEQTLELATLLGATAPGGELLRYTFRPTEYPDPEE
jgi:hypothetical protein